LRAGNQGRNLLPPSGEEMRQLRYSDGTRISFFRLH
jgi:hypothetical protein